MKVLAVYPYVPYPLNRGAYHRAFHLLKGLARNHDVDLLALSERGEGLEHKAVFEEFCHSVQTVPFTHPKWQKLFPERLFNGLPSTIAHWTIPEAECEIAEALGKTSYDAVHILDLVLAQFFLKKHTGIPLVLDRTRVDLQYQLMENKRLKFSLKNRLLNYENYSKLWAFEKAAARRCALEVVCGPDDASFVKKYISDSVAIEVIPNGVDLDYFHPDSSRDRR